MAYQKPNNRKRRRRAKRVQKLNMRRIDDFKYDLSHILDDMNNQNASAVKGAIYAKASKIGVKEAKNYIWEKEREGVLERDVAIRLTRLLTHYSVYR